MILPYDLEQVNLSFLPPKNNTIMGKERLSQRVVIKINIKDDTKMHA